MHSKPGSPRLHGIARLIVAILFLPVLALCGGWAYQQVAEFLDDLAYPPPGRILEVNGRDMHIHCRGTGSPTILVEQGVGGPSIDWNEINDRMAKITRVCDYDRAGMGYSAPAYMPTVMSDVVLNLHELLNVAEIDDDLVIVGWSAGGMYAREFYHQFPNHVKGLVLVDSPHEQSTQRMPPQPSNQANLDSLMRKYYQAQVGWIRLSGQVEEMFAQSQLPPEDVQRLIAIFEKTHTYRTLVDEGVGLEQDLARAVPPPKLGDIPLVVIAEGKPRHPYMIDNLALWHQLQGELAALSSDGTLVIARNSAHFIHRTEPELIVDAVNEVVGAVRNGHRLTTKEDP